MAEIEYQFHEERAAQAASYLLALHGRGMNQHLRLIKLLHFADRRCIHETGHPITGDRYLSMRNGIVLGNVLDRLQRPDEFPKWGDWIVRDRHNNIQRVPGRDNYTELSLYQLRILEETYNEYGSLKAESHNPEERTLSSISHDFPEWEKTVVGPDTSKLVDMSTMFRSMSMTDEAVEEIETDVDIGKLMTERYG